MSVKVAIQGSSVLTIPYGEGLTVGGILESRGIQTNERSTMTVNNEHATPATPVPDGSVVVVTPNISNGQ